MIKLIGKTKSKLLAVLLLLALSMQTFVGLAVASSVKEYPATKTINKNKLKYRPGELLVKFKPDVSVKDQIQSRNQVGAENVISDRASNKISHFKLKPGQSVEDAVKKLKADKNVLAVEPNYIYKSNYIPNDSNFINQWGLNNTGQTIGSITGTVNADINAPEAWDIEKGFSNPVTVAVIDTGIDRNHPDLINQIWQNDDEVNGNGIDDDQNGFIDDKNGYNFTGISQIYFNNLVPLGSSSGNKIYAQSIKGTGQKLSEIGLGLAEYGSPTGNITVSVRSSLTGPDLATYTITPTELYGSSIDYPYEIYKPLSSEVTLNANTTYYFVVSTTNSDFNNFYYLLINDSVAGNYWPDTYSDGNEINWNGSSWIENPANDIYFRTNRNSEPRDDNGHGTHVSGIIAAQSDLNGITGVNPGAKIMPLKVGDSSGYFYSSDIVDAIYYAADNGAKVINMSFGGLEQSLIEQYAINYAYNKGVVIFAAAGNEAEQGNPIEYPAAYEHVISVGATDNKDLKAYFSNYNSSVDISAPGVDIFSTMPTYNVPLNHYFNTDYDFLSGTSMASPMASGVASLLLAKNPALTPSEVDSLIESNSDDKGDIGRDNSYGYGRINAYKALQNANNSPPDPIVEGSISGNVIDSSGNSIVGSVVNVYDYNSFNLIKTVYTDANGNYIADALADGSYMVEFQSNSTELMTEWYNNQTNIFFADPVIISGHSNLINISAQLQNKDISGVVTDSQGGPIDSILVALFDNNGELNDITVTDFDGSYGFSGIAPGTYKIYFETYIRNEYPEDPSFFVPEWYNDQNSFDTATSVDTTSGPVIANVQLDIGAKISGYVSNSYGPANDGMDINVYDLNHNFVNFASTDDEGYYSLYVKQGSYKIEYDPTWFNSQYGTDYLVQWYYRQNDFSKAQVITASAGQNIENINGFFLPAPVQLTSLIADKPSPQSKNTTISFTATTNKDMLNQYQFWVNDGLGWKIAQPYSESNIFNWTPTKAGNYQIGVWVQASASTSVIGYDDVKIIDYVVQNSTIQSLTPNRPSPQAKNTTITFTADVGGNPDELYQYWVNDGNGWVIAQPYGAANIYNWKPAKPGNYQIGVWAKDKYSQPAIGYDDVEIIDYTVNEVKINSLTSDKASPQLNGTSIVFTADAIGNGHNQYQFWVNDGSGWVIAQPYSSSSTFNWTPTKAGNYQIGVWVKDQYSNLVGWYDDVKIINYKVSNTFLTGLTSDKSSPQLKSNSITFTATSAQGSYNQYQFWVNDGSGWVIAQSYSSSNTFNWNPGKAGNYQIGVWVRSNNTNPTVAYDDLKIIDYVVQNPTLQSLTPNRPSPQAKNTTITFMASVGGNPDELYEFWVNDGNGWIISQYYGPANTFKWSPTKPGNYQIGVWAKDKYSGTPYDDLKIINYTINEVKLNSLTSDKPSPHLNNGTPIVFTADASGNGQNQYQFWVNDGNGWVIAQPYSSSSTFNWTPTKAGNYQIGVWVKDQYSNQIGWYDDLKIINYKVSNTFLNNLTPDKSSPQLKSSSITFTATSAPGSDNQYQFWVNDGMGWKITQPYSSKNTFSWRPTKAGNYQIGVWVKTNNTNPAGGYDDLKIIDYVVQNPTLQSLTPNRLSPQAENTTITFTAGVGGNPDELYEFWVNDGNGWIISQYYGTANTFKWSPTKPGNYQIGVWAKDKYSGTPYDDLKIIDYTVNEVKLNSLTSDKPSPHLNNGTPIVFTADASGNGQNQYQFWVNDGSGWLIAQPYSSSSTFNWTPTKAGNYQIGVWVKDQYSNLIGWYDDVKIINYKVANTLLTGLTPDKSSPQLKSTGITFTATSTPGSDNQYQFWVKDGNGWVIAQPYSSKNTFNWTPTKAGNYQIGVWVKTNNTNPAGGYDDLKIIDYVVQNPTIQSLTPNRLSPQAKNTTITFTASVGGNRDELYEFWVNDGNGWIISQYYGTANTFKWSPTKPGNYQIGVWAKDKYSGQPYDDLKIIDYTVNEVKLNSLTPDKASPQLLTGVPIVFTADASGNGQNQYQFWVNDGSGWVIAQPYSSSSTFNWTPTKAGNYQIGVWVKDQYSNLLGWYDDVKIIDYLIN